MCHAAKMSSQPHRLVPLANGMTQLAMTLTLLMIAVILPMLAQLSPTGLVPEVPLLQAFENELGRGWTRLIIAILTIVCLCFSLLELSLPLHRMVSNHFPPSFFSDNFLSQSFFQSLGGISLAAVNLQTKYFE